MNKNIKKLYYIGLLAESLALPIVIHFPSFPGEGALLLSLIGFGLITSLICGVLLIIKNKNPLYFLFSIAVFVWIAWPKF